MKKTTPHWIIIGVLSALLIAIGFKFIVLGNTAKGDDGRIAVLLAPSVRVVGTFSKKVSPLKVGHS